MERLLFDNRPLVRPLRMEGMAEPTLVVGSLFQDHRMIGWRVGWLAGPGLWALVSRGGAVFVNLVHLRPDFHEAAGDDHPRARLADRRLVAFVLLVTFVTVLAVTSLYKTRVWWQQDQERPPSGLLRMPNAGHECGGAACGDRERSLRCRDCVRRPRHPLWDRLVLRRQGHVISTEAATPEDKPGRAPR